MRIRNFEGKERRKNDVQRRADAYQTAQARAKALESLRTAPGGAEAQVRVTDVDRDTVIALLGKAQESGALNLDEFNDRMSGALESKTRKDLFAVVRDLP